MDSLLFVFFTLFLSFTCKSLADQNENNATKLIVGAILDGDSRIGKEKIVAIEMAIEDFNQLNNQSLVLHVRNYTGNPFQAALAAQDLVSTQARAILGPQTWEASSLVAEVSSRNQVPILSFADTTPEWALKRWPFLFQFSPNKYAQMKAIAAIVQSWEWKQVTVIYEDIESSMAGVMPHLTIALQDVGVEINNVLALSSFASHSSLSRDLERLKQSQCRVFVVHLPLELAVRLFERAKRMKMMEKDFVWIATDAFTSVIHSINASVVSSMQGVIGIRGYFQEKKPRFQDFSKRFQKRFSLEYQEEDNHEPGIYAIQGYDAAWTVALAMTETNKTGQDLLEKILATNFNGLTRNVQIINQKVSPMRTFQIINVIGRSYREIGFWVDGIGFSETSNGTATNITSMKDLGQVFWPGGPWYIPRGWTPSMNDKPLIIGVPAESPFGQYVYVEIDPLWNKTSVKGFAIELFQAIVEMLPFYLPITFFPVNGSYDDLVKQIYLKKFDAVVGDVAIVSSRFQYAEFTHPYSESELVMVVPTKSEAYNKAWLFARPFTKAMWVLTFIVNVYNGFVVWLIERNHCIELRGSVLNQVGILLWMSFTTLFSLQGSKLHSNLSRMVVVVWLFIALVIMQTYTANLSSILTIHGLQPTIDSIESLQRSNAVVGHFGVSFVAKYLEEVLHFKPGNMKNYSSPDGCVKDLKSKVIAAVFIEGPEAKMFLARYCNGFTIAGPSFKVGGYGFAFPKGSPLVHQVTEALVKVTESGKLQDLERDMIASRKCNGEVESSTEDETFSLSPSNFWMLFVLTVGTSTIGLIIYVIQFKGDIVGSMHGHGTNLSSLLIVVKNWAQQSNWISRRVCNVAESPKNPPMVHEELET